MDTGIETGVPSYQQFRAYSAFVPELEDFGVNESQFKHLLSSVELHWAGGGLGTGDLSILFNRAASGQAPALGGSGSIHGVLGRSSGCITYEGVRSICKVLVERTTKARQSFVENMLALEEEAAVMEARTSRPSERDTPGTGDDNPVLQIMRRTMSRTSTRKLSHSSTVKSGGTTIGKSRREHATPKKHLNTSKLVAAMAECETPTTELASTRDESEEEGAIEELMPGRPPKLPSPPPPPMEPLGEDLLDEDAFPHPHQTSASKAQHSRAPLDHSRGLDQSHGQSPERGADQSQHEQHGPGGEGQQAAGMQEGQAQESGQGAGAGEEQQQWQHQHHEVSPPAPSDSPRKGGVRFGGQQGLSPHASLSSRHETRPLSAHGMSGRRAWTATSNRSSVDPSIMASVWLSKDPPTLVQEALLPPPCEFSAIRAGINKMQTLMRRGDFLNVGLMLKPLLADWEGAVADKHIRDAARREKMAKQARAKNKKGGGEPLVEEEQADDNAPKEVPPEAAIWLLIVAGRVAMSEKKLQSARMYMNTAESYLIPFQPGHSYHTTVPMCQGVTAYAAKDYASAAHHFARAHASSQPSASCACNPLASRNAAASLNNWGAALLMLGERSLAVRCFKSALSALDTQSPHGLATAPPKPPPAEPEKKIKQRPASAPAGKGKQASRPPLWGGGGSLDTQAATTAAANLKRALHASFAPGPSLHASLTHPHAAPFAYPSYGKGWGSSSDQLPSFATSALNDALRPSDNATIRSSMRPGSAHPMLGRGSSSARPAPSLSVGQSLAKASTNPAMLSGYAIATHAAIPVLQRQQQQQQLLQQRPSTATQPPSAQLPHTASTHAQRPSTAPPQPPTLTAQRFGRTAGRVSTSASTQHMPSPLKTFISGMVASQPLQVPVESIPSWAVRANEASMEEKAKKKAGGSAKKPPQPMKRADGKAPPKKKPAGFQLTFPADYYGPPSYGAANIKGLVARKGKKKGAKKK